MRLDRNLLLPVLLIAAVSGAALADGLPDGHGVRTPSGSSFTTEITAGDADDFVFEGYAGQTLKVSVKATKGSALVPVLEILRPGGTQVDESAGLSLNSKGSKVSAALELDATGIWKVRVSGEGATTGGYTVKIVYSGTPARRLPEQWRGTKAASSVATRETDAYPFLGYEGQRIVAKLKAGKGSAFQPVLRLLDPSGAVAAEESGSSNLTLERTLDATGDWSLEVRGQLINVDTGETSAGDYSLKVKATTLRPAPAVLPDANDQFRFQFPATGGASFSYTLRFKGGTPTLSALTSPTGSLVQGLEGATKSSGTKLAAKGFKIPDHLPQGVYTLTFDDAAQGTTDVYFQYSVSLPRGDKKRKVTQNKVEPFLTSNTARATAGTLITLNVGQIIDPNETDPSAVRAFVGGFELLHPRDPNNPNDLVPGVDLFSNNTIVRGRVPAGVPDGTYDVSVASTTGQVAVRTEAIEVVAPPHLTSIDPASGSSAGNFEVTLVGSGFNSRALGTGILLDTSLPLTAADDAAVTLPAHTDTQVTFNMPGRSPGIWYLAVIDKDTGGISNAVEVEFLSTAGINRVVPGLVPIVGGDTVYVNGTNFRPTDQVYLETTTAGTYELMTSTYVSAAQHFFVAPARPKGPYRIYVRDDQGFETPTRSLSYFSYADLTAGLGLAPQVTGSEQFDAWTSSLADYDRDGSPDLFLSRRGSDSKSSTTQTRVLRNDGSGGLIDVTAQVMPAVTADDDWRADRIWATDVTADGYPDIVIVTNHKSFPGSAKSHVRMLVNEPKSAMNPAVRVFRDRTGDLMAPPRISPAGWSGSGGVADNWRGLDMWVGDVDLGKAGPPEIVIVHDELKEEIDTFCGNYCASPYSGGYTYSFYWGGSRAFKWDPSRRGGLGQYKFEHNFFPRKSGITVAIFNPPPGVTIPTCSGGSCRGTFTPFAGQRVALGQIDSDGKPDVAVVSNATVMRGSATISSLQVAINKFNAGDGADVTDITEELTNLGVDLKGDAVAIGQPGYPDGNALGVVAVAKAGAPVSGSALKLLRFKVSPFGGAGTFEDITSAALPSVGLDAFQASQIRFVDVDEDGDQDLVAVANAAPSGTEPALRVLRNVAENGQVGIFRNQFDGLIRPLTTPSEHFEGDTFVIGDLDGNGALDFVMSRAVPVGEGSQTRALGTDK